MARRWSAMSSPSAAANSARLISRPGPSWPWRGER
jgi:hypothetical protein